MHRRIISAFFCLACSVCVPAFAGTPDKAAALKPLSRIEIKEGRLSVELVDADFGDVMHAVAEKAGITVEITGGVYKRTVTTSFRGLDLERGIARLMSLVQEKNYMIRYDAKGRVSKVEVYSAGPTPARPGADIRPQTGPSSARSPVPPAAVPAGDMPRIRKNPPVSKRILPPFGEQETDISTPRLGDKAMDNEGYEEEMPFEPSEKVPAYIPPLNPQE